MAAAVVAISGVAVAADDFGIPTYPGAKTDADTQAICAQPQLSLVKQREERAGLAHTQHCYRTSDSLSKVIDFYKKQNGLVGGVDASGMGASFCNHTKGCNESSAGTSINLTSFWVLPGGKMNKDVLITVIDRAKK